MQTMPLKRRRNIKTNKFIVSRHITIKQMLIKSLVLGSSLCIKDFSSSYTNALANL